MADVGGLPQCCQKQLRLLPADKQSFTVKLCFVIVYILVFSLFVFNLVLLYAFKLRVKANVIEYFPINTR